MKVCFDCIIFKVLNDAYYEVMIVYTLKQLL